MKINYPSVTLPNIPTIDDEEVLYWLARTDDLRRIHQRFYEKLFKFDHDFKITLGLVASITKRQIELCNSIFILITSKQIRDPGILLVSLYELTLDIQYIAVTPNSEQVWFSHSKENTKPWTITQKINAVFKSESDIRAELSFHKKFCMIKHGNIVAKSIAFDIFLVDEKLALSELQPGYTNIYFYAIGYLIKRSILASFKILERVNIHDNELLAELDTIFSDFDHDHRTFMELKLIEAEFPNDPQKQEEVVRRLSLRFSKNSG